MMGKGELKAATKLLAPSSQVAHSPLLRERRLPHSPAENVVEALLLWGCLRPREIQLLFNNQTEVWIHYKNILTRSILPILSIFIENIGLSKLEFPVFPVSQYERQINISVQNKKLLLKSLKLLSFKTAWSLKAIWGVGESWKPFLSCCVTAVGWVCTWWWYLAGLEAAGFAVTSCSGTSFPFLCKKLCAQRYLILGMGCLCGRGGGWRCFEGMVLTL